MAEENVSSVAPASQPSKTSVKESERQDVTTLHERTIATLSYIGFLAIVPFYLKKDSEFCRFHGKQGMTLSIIFFIASLLSIINFLFDLMIALQVSIFFVMGFSALSGRWRKLPLIYDWSCQLEDALTLKTKEQDLQDLAMKPNQVKPESSQQ